MDEYCERAVRRLRKKFGIEKNGEAERSETPEEIAQRHRIDHARYISSPQYRASVAQAHPQYARALERRERGE